MTGEVDETVDLSLVHDVVLLPVAVGRPASGPCFRDGVCSSVRTRAGHPGPPTIASDHVGANRRPRVGVYFSGVST